MKRLLIVAQADFGRLVDPYQYALHLRDEYDVTYLCWDYGVDRVPEEGVRVLWVPRTGGMVRRLLRLILRARKEIRSGRYDLVFVVHFPGCVLLRCGARRTPMVMDIRTGYVRSEGFRLWFNNTLIRLESLFFRNVTVISERLREELKISPGRSHILPLGALPMDLAPKAFDTLRLLYIGTLQHRHLERTVEGLALARKTLGSSVPLTYDIVGTGPEEDRQKLLSAIERTGEAPYVRYHGYVPHKSLRPYLERGNAGVAFIPITRFFHPQPSTKVIEYLLGGMPVIATATRENIATVTEDRGVVHADTPEGFAEAVRTLWSRRERYRSDQLRGGMKGSTWDVVINKNLRPYLASVTRPRVAIGTPPKTERASTSILTVTEAFMAGLGHRYIFRPFYLHRRSGTTGGARFTPANIGFFLRHVLGWTWMLLRFRPAIAHFPVTSGWNVEKSLSMLLVARFFGIRTVGHLHGGSFDDEWGRMARFRRINAERALRNLDMLIVLGSYWQTWTVKQLGLLPERVRVVNNPIDVRFEQEGLAFPLPGGSGVFFLGVVGKRKGVFEILEAAHLLQSSGCTPSIRIAGPEDDPGALERVGLRIRDLALNNVILAGPVYGDDKLKLYRDNGIFLFPSYNENFPLVVLEAAASGRAIVTTRVGALPEFFADGESVVFVEPGNAGQIAAAVKSLVEDGERRLRLGEGARRVFLERLSRAQILEALDETYRRALARDIKVY